MKKSTIAGLLGLVSIPALADQWICDSTHAGVVSSVTSLTSGAGEYTGFRYVVDVDEGFKNISNRISPDNRFADDYEGTCQVFGSKFIKCDEIDVRNDAYFIQSLMLDTVHGTYFFSYASLQHNAVVDSHVGNCAEI